jgi:outer membrane protein insertion porin family
MARGGDSRCHEGGGPQSAVMSTAAFPRASLAGRVRALALALLAAVPIAARALVALADPPPDGTVISEVRIEGLTRVPTGELTRVMELRAGAGFRRDALRSDLQAIANTGKVDPVSIAADYQVQPDGRVAVIITARENPTLRRLQVIGNVYFSEAQLKAEIDYKEGDILPAAARTIVIQSLRGFYSRGGYKNVRVDVTTEKDPDDPTLVDMLVTVDEGERIRIDDLIFRGNTFHSSVYLRTRVMNSGSWLIFDNWFDDRAFDDDLRTVEAVYRSSGFLDVTARRGEFIYSAEKAEVSPVIEIREGPRYRVKAIDVRGAAAFTKAEIDAVFAPLVGDYHNGRKFEEAVSAVRKMYGDQGYIDVQIDSRVEKEPETGLATWVVTIAEGGIITVGEVTANMERYAFDIELGGVEKLVNHFSPGTKTETVLREVRLRPGEKYRTADEARTVERLKNLGIFEEVSVRRKPTADPNVQDAEIVTRDRHVGGFFVASLAYGEQSGPALTLGYVNPNLYGEADRFSVRATVGERTRNVRIGYYDRYIGDSDWSYEFTAFRDFERYRVYSQRTYGLWNEFGDRWNDDTTALYRVRLEHTKFRNVRGNPRYDFDSYYTIAGRFRLVQDKVDDIRYPTRGYRIGGAVEGGYADGPLTKFTHEYDRYFHLGRQWVYMYGHTVGVSPFDADEFGLGERFFVGGSSTLRGFRPREVGPRDPDERRLAIGGATRLTQRHEIRYPFTRFMYGRVFTDAAILDKDAFSVDRPRAASGFGVNADLGPVILDVDLGFAWLKRSSDRTRVLSFRVGSDY